MPAIFFISSETPEQMATFIRLMAMGQKMPAEPKPVCQPEPEIGQQIYEGKPVVAGGSEIRDMAGTLYNPDLHSTRKSDGTPVLKNDGTFAARRGTKTRPPTAPTTTEQEQPDGGSPTEENPELYMPKLSDGNEAPSGAVETAGEFAAILIDILTGVPTPEQHALVMRANSPVISRLFKEGEEALLDAIDDVAIDAL